MLYLGGKERIGRQVSRAILARTEKRHSYLEPFFGGGSSYRFLAPYFAESRVGDIHPDLMVMWQAAKDGWQPPTSLSYAEYNRVRYIDSPNELKGFAGFACSFGGKWFGGYAKNAKEQNYAEPQSYRVSRIGNLLKVLDTMIVCATYDAWEPKDSVVYCDPPYAGTTKYSISGFNTKRFWRIMDYWVEKGASVFVSEYDAPVHWNAILEIEVPCKVSGTGTNGSRRERLFTR